MQLATRGRAFDAPDSSRRLAPSQPVEELWHGFVTRVFTG